MKRGAQAGQASDTPLYPRLLGASWPALPAPLRALYGSGDVSNASGVFRVHRPGGPLRRLLGWLMGLPPAGEAVPTELCIRRTAGRETWSRQFGSHALVTFQSGGPDGRLAERSGPVEVWMQLSVADGALHFRSSGGRLLLWGRTLRAPRWLLPQATARSWSEPGERAVRVRVTIRASGAGELVTYEGWVREVPSAPER